MFHKIDLFLKRLNSNNYFIGLMMILLNIGSKYFVQELGNTADYFFNFKIIRRLSIFTVFFVATRDIKTSIILTAAFIIIALELFNEKSVNCILPKRLLDTIDTNKDGKLSPSEIQNALKLLEKAGYVKLKN
tara:strand:+ start:148 stop:543 length:396 start_codon:yes stop_codon:yes gene_type:complete